MAKLIVTYEGTKIKRDLHVFNEVFTYTMLPTKYGKTGDVPAFDTQLEKKYPDISDKVLNAAEKFSFGDDGDIEDALNYLTYVEKQEGKFNY